MVAADRRQGANRGQQLPLCDGDENFFKTLKAYTQQVRMEGPRRTIPQDRGERGREGLGLLFIQWIEPAFLRNLKLEEPIFRTRRICVMGKNRP